MAEAGFRPMDRQWTLDPNDGARAPGGFTRVRSPEAAAAAAGWGTPPPRTPPPAHLALAVPPDIRSSVEAALDTSFGEVRDVLQRFIMRTVEEQVERALERYSAQFWDETAAARLEREGVQAGTAELSRQKAALDQTRAQHASEQQRLRQGFEELQAQRSQLQDSRGELMAMRHELDVSRHRLRAEQGDLGKGWAQLKEERNQILQWHQLLTQMDRTGAAKAAVLSQPPALDAGGGSAKARQQTPQPRPSRQALPAPATTAGQGEQTDPQSPPPRTPPTRPPVAPSPGTPTVLDARLTAAEESERLAGLSLPGTGPLLSGPAPAPIALSQEQEAAKNWNPFESGPKPVNFAQVLMAPSPGTNGDVPRPILSADPRCGPALEEQGSLLARQASSLALELEAAVPTGSARGSPSSGTSGRSGKANSIKGGGIRPAAAVSEPSRSKSPAPSPKASSSERRGSASPQRAKAKAKASGPGGATAAKAAPKGGRA